MAGLRCIIIQNFIKIGRTAAEISHLTFFKMATVRHLGFFKLNFWTFHSVRSSNVRQRAKFRRIRSNRCWNIAIYLFFSRWRPSTILDLWGKFWEDQLREFDGLYHCAKFGGNHMSRFDNTQVWIFCMFGLKTPIHAHFWGCSGGKNRGKWQFLNSYPSRNAITRNWRHIKQTA